MIFRTWLYNLHGQEGDHGVEISACSSTSSNTTQSIPVKTTEGAQVYRLQKQVEEMLGNCRKLAFITSETSVLTNALSQCQTVMETLASSATDSSATHLPPTFSSISQAGGKEFNQQPKLC